MDAREPTRDRPSYEELERVVAEQALRIERLEKRIEELTRAGKRQAAPFRKEEPTEPLGKAKRRQKKPGRKSGEAYGEHRRREEPPEEPDEIHRAVLPECCPHCEGQQLKVTKQVTQTQVELPTKPIVRRNAEALSKLIGWDWRGVLVHDGWAVYDAFTRATHQTCVAHTCCVGAATCSRWRRAGPCGSRGR